MIGIAAFGNFETENVMKSQSNSRRSLFAIILRLAWPTIVEQALQTIVIYINTAMIGELGKNASAAVGLTATVCWLINSPAFAIGIGATACISRAIGEENAAEVRTYAAQAVKASLALGLIMTALTLGISPFLPAWLGAEPVIQHDASVYFALICAPYLLNAMNIIFGAVLRGAGDTRTAMRVNLIINLVHILFNFLFIYETRTVTLFGLSFSMFGLGWGIAGAGISTAICYVLGGLWMIRALRKHEIFAFQWKNLREKHAPALRAMLGIATPIALSRLATCLGQVVFTRLVTSLGTTVFAAHSIALTAEEAFYIPGYGMQSAATTLTGNAIGARDAKRLHETSRMLIWLSFGFMSMTGGLLFLLSRQMMQLFTPDADVIALGASALRIVALSEPVFGISIILEGIFNGAGDTRLPFLYSLIGMWGIRILGTFLCVHVFHLGLNAVWLCMVGDNVCRGILLALRFRKKGLSHTIPA